MRTYFFIVIALAASLASAQNTFPINGKVGIGTSNPGVELDVIGRVQFHSLGDINNFIHFDYVTNGNKIRSYGTNLFLETRNDTEDIEFRTNNSTYSLMTVKGTGNIGIGTTLPDSKLHISNGNTGGSPHSFSDLTVEDDDSGMISILTPNNKYGYFGFADRDDDYVGGMQYNHASNLMTFRVNNHDSDMVINSSGYVGIGTVNPETRLHVAHGVRLRKSTIGLTVANADNGWIRDDWLTGNYGPAKWDQTKKKWVRPGGTYNDIGGIVYQDEGTYFLRHPAGSKLEFTNGEFLNTSFMFAHMYNGNVGIGTNTPDSKLSVNGKIHAKEVKVDLVGWPDYVFKKEYLLPTLEEIEAHIKEKGHLQNIPSAQEVAENGIELGEMNKLLLQKIEELTLYTISQHKQLEEQQYKNKELEVRLAKLEALIRK